MCDKFGKNKANPIIDNTNYYFDRFANKKYHY